MVESPRQTNQRRGYRPRDRGDTTCPPRRHRLLRVVYGEHQRGRCSITAPEGSGKVLAARRTTTDPPPQPGPGRASYVTSRRIVRTTPAASGIATQKTIETEICGT